MALYIVKKSAIMKAAVFGGSKEVNMVVPRKSFVWGEVPKSLISLVLGILATIAVLLALSSLIVNPIDISGGITQEVQGRISIVFIGMIAVLDWEWPAGWQVATRYQAIKANRIGKCAGYVRTWGLFLAFLRC